MYIKHTYIMHNYSSGDLYKLHIVDKCPVDGNILFTETNFTISNGNRICFDVIIVDDDVIEYTRYDYFFLHLQNGTYHDHLYDKTRIRITDNEGWFLLILKSFC